MTEMISISSPLINIKVIPTVIGWDTNLLHGRGVWDKCPHSRDNGRSHTTYR